LPFYLERRDQMSWESMQTETEEESERRFRYGDFTPEKGLWYDRDLGEGN